MWRWLRRKSSRSRLENLTDYRDLLRVGGLVSAVLWPLYGLFCRYVLGLEEFLGVRWILMGTFLGLW